MPLHTSITQEVVNRNRFPFISEMNLFCDNDVTINISQNPDQAC